MIEYHDAWMLKDENDLRLAEVAIRQEVPITDGAIYHTQQCAEKALKGFLAFKRSEIKKTHNLAELVMQCAEFDSDFESLLLDADDLTPKATEFRYPDDFIEIADQSQLFPDVEEVEAAIVKAKHIFEFVLSKLNGDIGSGNAD
jgi:HEPN domain-containing protein